ncbi:MAG: GTP cyclohydrolase II [Calditrichaeota bacterium]|nr:GTP cyclohydrolase II [Calditrichota bacterium]MCB9391348.1 GTP cyclohydrolase II [Calditrichota bacterium]
MTLPAHTFAKALACQTTFLQWPSGQAYYPLKIVAEAKLPTRSGEFRIVAFSPMPDGKEHIAMVRGDLRGAESVPVRVHSECLTGDVMGSYRCDCRDQLEAALEHMATQERGIVLYLRQEGRGIGLVNKLRAYVLQEQGLDTVDANHALGFDDDERDYRVAAEMLKALGVKSVKLLSNNPKKVAGLEQYGMPVTERVQHQLPSNRHNHNYLKTKARKSGHLLEV